MLGRWVVAAVAVAGCDRVEGALEHEVEALTVAAPDAPLLPTPSTAEPRPRRPFDPVDPPPEEPFRGSLTFIAGSTRKVETLIGDVDRETGLPTLSLTEQRYGIEGTDLGSSFEHRRRIWFLFGDTLGDLGGDTLATTEAPDGAAGVRLDFVTDTDGRYLRIRPDGEPMLGFEVPSAGISLHGVPYVVVKTNHVDEGDEYVSVLTRFDERNGTFTSLREVSRRADDGRFIKMSLREVDGPMDGLVSDGPWVLMWGTGQHRASDAYLAVVPARDFETGEGTRYWAGEGPVWSEHETDAVPIVEHPTMGDLSVTWVEALGVWIMVYDSRDPRGVLARWSVTPWGPWSEPQEIFHHHEGYGLFIHEAGQDDGLAGPVIGEAAEDPDAVGGGAYGPYVVERFTEVEDDVLSIEYTLSTWNPYLVVLMRSEFAVVEAAD